MVARRPEKFIENQTCLIHSFLLFGCGLTFSTSNGFIVKRSFKDESVSGYLTERICWWNEACKEEFQIQFKCKCPAWFFCRSPGRYYNAFCSVAETGYIWSQPATPWANDLEGV